MQLHSSVWQKVTEETLTSILPRRVMTNWCLSSSEYVFADIWIFIATHIAHTATQSPVRRATQQQWSRSTSASSFPSFLRVWYIQICGRPITPENVIRNSLADDFFATTSYQWLRGSASPVFTAIGLRLCQIWRKSVHGELLGKLVVKYNKFFLNLFITGFSGTHSSNPSKDSRNSVLFEGFVHIAPQLVKSS